MIGVRPAGEDRVQVDARYEGHEQHGEASFHVEAADRRIEWAAPSGYRGWMKVDPDGAGSRLTLFLETVHGSERDNDIAPTLGAIRMLVESEVGSPRGRRRRHQPRRSCPIQPTALRSL